MSMRYLITVGAIVFAALTPAAAHHSDAGLDMRTVLTMEGTVKEFSLRNPHSYLVVEVTDDECERNLVGN